MARRRSRTAIGRRRADHRSGYTLIEVLVALSLTGLVFLLAADILGALSRGWFGMQDVREDLVLARELEIAIGGFARNAGRSSMEVIVESDKQLASGNQTLAIDDTTHQLVWTREVSMAIELPEANGSWRLVHDSQAEMVQLIHDEHIVASAGVEPIIPLPCTFDTIGRRCLRATMP